ncbi:MAG: phage portal protein [Planctomycetia bacterium]|nr:phage portal protein [Planctomycetia bacterium]
MRTYLAAAFVRLARWLHPKAASPSWRDGPWTSPPFLNASHRQPSPQELLTELKGAAWTCASLNAAACAHHAPRLYVATHDEQPPPRCRTRTLSRAADERLRALPYLPAARSKSVQIEEVLDHPLLTLLRQVNPVHNHFDLFEMTTLYQEVQGSAYWYLAFDALGVPTEIWLLPSQHVTPRREPGSANIVDYYLYRGGASEQRFAPREIIHFRYPDPRDPYLAGLSPLRACFEQVALLSDYAAMKRAIYDNHALPSAVISPDEALGDEERDRLEAQWNERFRRAGSGRVLIGESSLKVQLLSQSLGDLAALADMRATREDIGNAFHVPLAFLTSETNLANLQAAEHQHLAKAVAPRIQRRDEKLNEQLVPLFDPTGRLFLASDDPVPANREEHLKQQEADLKFGVVTINEVRQERGLPPVDWGHTPWLPLHWAPSDYQRSDLMADAGRNRE